MTMQNARESIGEALERIKGDSRMDEIEWHKFAIFIQGNLDAFVDDRAVLSLSRAMVMVEGLRDEWRNGQKPTIAQMCAVAAYINKGQ